MLHTELMNVLFRGLNAWMKSYKHSLPLPDLYKDKGLFERLTYMEADFPGANIIMHKEGKLTKVCLK